MPKIPTYLAQLDYRPARGDLETAAVPGRALARFGETAVGVAASAGESLAAKFKEAKAKVEEADATARYLDGLMESARQTVEDFKNFDPMAPYRGFDERIGPLTEEIAQGIEDGGARNAFRSTARTLADVQRPIVLGEGLHRLTEQARASLPGHLRVYGKAAQSARHPLELDTISDLAEREIRNKAEVGVLTQKQADGLLRDFYDGIAEGQAQDAIDDDPQAALARLKDGADFPALSETARARLIDVADLAVRDQLVRRQTEDASVRRALLTELPAYLDSLQDGEPADEDRFSRDRLVAILGEHEGAARRAAIEQAKTAGAVMAELRWASATAIAERHATSESDASSRDAGDALDRALARRDKQLRDQPADYALANPHIARLHAAMARAKARPEMPQALAGALQAGQNGIADPSLAAAPSSAETRRAATHAYANATLAEQERLGVPEARRRLLPDAMARDLAAQIAAGEPAEADKLLADLAAEWGEDWPRAFADLARHDLPGEVRLLAGLDQPVARQGFVKLLAAQAADPVALRAKAGDEAAAVDGMISIELASLKEASGDGETVLAMGYGGSPSASSPARPQPLVEPDLSLTYRADGGDHRNKVFLYDKNGQRVEGIDAQGRPSLIYVPEGVDLRVFAQLGEADRKRALSEAGLGSVGDRLAYLKNRLMNFDQGGIWDLQRAMGKKDASGKIIHYPEFVDVATIAIGIYCAALGLPQHLALKGQQDYARKASNFGNAKVHKDYAPLPIRNVKNTELGYSLYEKGMIPGPAE